MASAALGACMAVGEAEPGVAGVIHGVHYEEAGTGPVVVLIHGGGLELDGIGASSASRVGLSLGGAIALNFGLERPDRTDRLVHDSDANISRARLSKSAHSAASTGSRPRPNSGSPR